MSEPDKTDSARDGRISASLLITGIVALIISIWGLAGGAAGFGGAVSLGWVLVVGAIVVGLLLVITPRRKS
ncbi:MAG TPA: hypothetical protein VK083_16290 [Nocardia sp.]|uniref:hypothetical protein n=1 Tax=Nocardia TaxID=1817 RepID=UPI002456D98E|nr:MULTISPECIES: hypothetical protein [Nocardia]HLS78343.1 hypothetical protein [Nocardia sp.]